ncbi:Periplasmic [Fe] hydrogenase [Lachnospiraceae bacterium TWA4]|nr:Periplasmic [Fe] hydrogenase [Lachnospiraceae bacterium TWA4]
MANLTTREYIANLVLDVSPNLTIIVDSSMKFLEFSAAAERHFKITRDEALSSTHLYDLMDTKDFDWVFEHKESLRRYKVEFKKYNFYADMLFEYIPQEDAVLCILVDVTKEKQKEEEEFTRNVEAVEKAQSVIENQMKMVHLIAGLLGETTAETKVTLTNLCQTLLGETQE